MKVVLLAGGFGSRLSEESRFIPKPLVEIGGKPILWHIMKIYSHYGFNEFVILLGYKGHLIKEYFSNYFLHQSNVSIDLSTNTTSYHGSKSESWKIHLIDTGLNTLTGGRIKRAQEHIGNERFLLTYGDGVSNVDISKLVDFHIQEGKIATLTAVSPTARFGGLIIENNIVQKFSEKPQQGEGLINGGFFVFEPYIFDYLTEGDQTILERTPLEKLTQENQLTAYHHDGFWQCMDTLREKNYLQELWDAKKAPWKQFN